MAGVVRHAAKFLQNLPRLALCALACVCAPDGRAAPVAGLSPALLGVIVNRSDPASVRLGNYYAARRGIPADNVVEISFVPGADALAIGEFRRVYSELERRLPPRVEALALAWTRPYRVGCGSITAAFASGSVTSTCAGCEATPLSPYFNSDATRPHSQYGLRPTMMLAASEPDLGFKLVDRGIASDGTAPWGTAYLVSTSDRSRNVRAETYADAMALLDGRFAAQIVQGDLIRHRQDVMFYFTGLPVVREIDTNRYLPGAIADHLTSVGGQPGDSGQMSSLRWIAAGATGSYGTVEEPCNHTQKFPNVPILLKHYLRGETLIEAYWKSVLMPAQGVFIGEPLARPFGRHTRPGAQS